jgi:hypothetical protein
VIEEDLVVVEVELLAADAHASSLLMDSDDGLMQAAAGTFAPDGPPRAPDLQLPATAALILKPP